MGGLIFTKINHDEFMALPSNQDRLEYLQKWYAYLLKKAESCKANLESCSAGITKLAVDAANANRIVVMYQAKNGAETTTGIEPQGSDDQGIRSIEEDTTTEAGRSYTITYGANSSTYTFLAKAGDTGDDGSYDDVGDTYYNSSGLKQWTGRASGFTANAKVFSGAVTGINAGATGLSMTLGFFTTTIDAWNLSVAGCGCKTSVAKNENIVSESSVDGTKNQLAVSEANQEAMSNDVSQMEVEVNANDMEKTVTSLRVPGLRNESSTNLIKINVD